MTLIANPEAGDQVAGGPEFWLFTRYDKNEMDDLTPKQREVLKEHVKG